MLVSEPASLPVLPVLQVIENGTTISGDRRILHRRKAHVESRRGETVKRLTGSGETPVTHRHGVEVHIWTLNDEAAVSEMLQLDVDGIMSDFPGLALKVAASRG